MAVADYDLEISVYTFALMPHSFPQSWTTVSSNAHQVNIRAPLPLPPSPPRGGQISEGHLQVPTGDTIHVLPHPPPQTGFHPGGYRCPGPP